MFWFFRKRESCTVISEVTELTGELRAKGTVQIQGIVRADIDVDGLLEILPSGEVEGQIVRADIVRISGKLRAFVQAKRVEILKSGKLLGDVETQALDIQSGAIFAGRSQMNPGETPSVGPGNGLTLEVPALPQREASPMTEVHGQES
ncbi:polymer-forming cytoskeletal protein [Leptolyngbya sp. FACHB-261]|uniref:bactofilin family protein n=1 Tax=Leptolyngbya sp. FACHB-261 TaxID=2692806 RepID=UPI00168283A6|nr:polymer-forming cytoskeletal protein [Leptolyngbya sp. FACHB-261]MBD2100310.1 polymer-forming cytoskeletal protein [Leptolyngbya sp. FACHB-261]